MNVFRFPALIVLGTGLKCVWCFLSDIQKDQTLKIIETEIFNMLVEEGYSDLNSKLQDLYIWLLEH